MDPCDTPSINNFVVPLDLHNATKYHVFAEMVESEEILGVAEAPNHAI